MPLPPNTRDVAITGPLDLKATLAPHGKGMDPAKRLADGAFWRAWHTPIGPATIRIERTEAGVRGTAWGKGAEHALEILPDLVGADDDPTELVPHHDVVRELLRRNPGIRFGKTHDPIEALISAIPGQRVTGKAAGRTRKELRLRYGEIAPGPAGLRLPPDPERLAVLTYAHFHELGLERTRATTLLEVCRRANRIRQLAGRPPEEASAALQSIRGIGPWTANHVVEKAWGWTDGVQEGDYWLPSVVTWVLTGQARGTDEEMLALLEPYRPHRGRVTKLLSAAHEELPRFGPRVAIRDFRGE